MIEQQLADRFRTAVENEPPLGFEPDEIVDRAVRGQRRRYAVIGTSAATTAVAIVAVTVFAMPGNGFGGQVTPAQSDTSSSAPVNRPTVPTTPTPSGAAHPPEKTDSAPPMAPPTFPGSDAAVEQLGQVIPQVLAEKVPGLRFTAPNSGTLMVDAEQHSVGGAYLVAGTKKRYVSIFVSHTKHDLDLGGDLAADGGWGDLVSDTTNPDGSQLRVYRFDGDGADGLYVAHIRTDGVIVHADTTAKSEPGQQGLAVTEEELTALATDPRLTF